MNNLKRISGNVLYFIVLTVVLIISSGCSSSLLKISYELEEENENEMLDAGETASLVVHITNKGKKPANEVSVQITGDMGKEISMPKSQHIGDIAKNQTKSATFPITVTDDAKDGVISLKIAVTEKSGHIPKPLQKAISVKSAPPLLTGAYQIQDSSKEEVLNASELAKLTITVNNEGKGVARDVTIHISDITDGVLVPSDHSLGEIVAEQTKSITLPITLSKDIKDKTFYCVIHIREQRGNNPKPFTQEFELKGPLLENFLYFKVKKVSDIQAGLYYLEEFPDGKYFKEIENAIEDLRWSAMKTDDTISSYKEYLACYPQGKYVKEAKLKIEELENIAETKRLDTYDAYKKFIEIWPDSPWASEAKKRTTLRYWQNKLNRKQNSHNCCQLAKALVEKKGELGYAEAKMYYSKAIQLDKNNEQAYIDLGRIFFDEGLYNEAIEQFTQALTIHKSYGTYYYLAKTNEKLRRKDMAINFYSQAIEMRSNDVKCLYSRGLLYWQSGQFGKAKADFLKVVEISPDSEFGESAKRFLQE